MRNTSTAKKRDSISWRRQVRAFTLSELLVVIVVISILAGLLIPGLQAARRTAMAVKGSSNIGQLAKAQLLYAQENEGKFTTLWADDTTATWQQRLYPYVGINVPIWDIRTLNSLRMDPLSIFNVPDSTPKSARTSGATSIGLNGWMTLQYGTWNYKALAVQRPSQIIMLGEMYPEKNTESIQGPPATFNRGGRTKMIMAFCDAHVESVDLKSLSGATVRAGQVNLWNWWIP